MRENCLRGFGLWTTKAQTSLRICTVWSASLLFTDWKVSYQNLLQAKFQFSSKSLQLRKLVWFSLCRRPGRLVLSSQGPYEKKRPLSLCSLQKNLTWLINGWKIKKRQNQKSLSDLLLFWQAAIVSFSSYCGLFNFVNVNFIRKINNLV